MRSSEEISTTKLRNFVYAGCGIIRDNKKIMGPICPLRSWAEGYFFRKKRTKSLFFVERFFAEQVDVLELEVEKHSVPISEQFDIEIYAGKAAK